LEVVGVDRIGLLMPGPGLHQDGAVVDEDLGVERPAVRKLVRDPPDRAGPDLLQRGRNLHRNLSWPALAALRRILPGPALAALRRILPGPALAALRRILPGPALAKLRRILS